MRRRLILAGSLAMLGMPLVADAQRADRVPRVGMLFLAAPDRARPLIDAFEDGTRRLGYAGGRNIVYDHRFADRKPERLVELASEMVRLKVDVIVTGLNEQTAAARRATTVIPIVTYLSTQPVAAGFIASLSRPGGNVTGLTADVDPEIWGKRLQILKEIVPRLRRGG